jgi:hypothetical protein
MKDLLISIAIGAVCLVLMPILLPITWLYLALGRGDVDDRARLECLGHVEARRQNAKKAEKK